AWIDHEDHAQTHVEGAEHLVGTDAASLLQELEDRRHLPGSPVDARAQALGKAAGQVAEDSAARDVRRALPPHGLQLVQVRTMWFEQDVTEWPLELRVDMSERH